MFSNTKTSLQPEVADHPSTRADIVLGTEGTYAPHIYKRNGVLMGFDLEFTKAACRLAGKTCAIVTVPWLSVWPSNLSQFGWPRNTKTYAGEAHHSRWVHCSMGTWNTVARQQSVAFTHSTTDPSTLKAGFVVSDAVAATFRSDAAGVSVGVISGWATSTYFMSQLGHRFMPSTVVQYITEAQIWAALTAGDVGAVYVDTIMGSAFVASGNGYQLMYSAAGWSNGVAYGCHPEYGDVVAALNRGILAFKATQEYADLCARYPEIRCDFAGTTYINLKTVSHPEIANHPPHRADIVIGTEADFVDHNFIRNGILGGFDLELTQALCALIGRTCSVITVPWQAVWTADFSVKFGWPANHREYPGEGFQRRWFHCTLGTINTIARQQSVAFTSPYTNGTFQAGFVVADAAAPTFPEDAEGRTVGLVGAWAVSTYFHAQLAVLFNPKAVLEYADQGALWAALVSGVVDAVYIYTVAAAEWLSHQPGYQVAVCPCPCRCFCPDDRTGSAVTGTVTVRVRRLLRSLRLSRHCHCHGGRCRVYTRTLTALQ